MDTRDHHVGRIATEVSGKDEIVVDVGALVRRLILFETCTVESIRLEEIPALVRTFGAGGLLELLDSGVVRIVCDAMTVGQIGQTLGLQTTARRGGPLPLGSYRLATVQIADRPHYLHQALQEVHKAGMSFRDAKRLKKALASRLLAYPSDAGQAGVADTIGDLRHLNPSIWEGIRFAVRKETNRDLGPTPDLRVEVTDDGGDFRIFTSFGGQLGITSEAEHRLVERGVLAVAGLNQRIRLMASFNAVTGFQEDEVHLFERKLSLLWTQVNPSAQEERFDRVVTVAGLPSLDALPAGTTIDVKQLLRIRGGDECRELRSWLRQSDAETDDEIAARVRSIHDHVAALTRSPGVRLVRFLVTAGVGTLPGIGLVAGPLLTAADTFLVERIMGKPGPTALLGSHYQSIFVQAPPS